VLVFNVKAFFSISAITSATMHLEQRRAHDTIVEQEQLTFFNGPLVLNMIPGIFYTNLGDTRTGELGVAGAPPPRNPLKFGKHEPGTSSQNGS
jgi:hypothetical protein